MAETIDRSNFFTFTQGHFEPAAAPLREPDYTSKSSSYWFTDEGVYRQSDHWGSAIASCTWSLGDEKVVPCYKTVGLGQRTGYIPWDGFETPDATIEVTHRFGKLDYDAIGALPLGNTTGELFPDPDVDVFKVKREWFVEGPSKVTVAGKTVDYRPHGMWVEAAGEAYADPHDRRVAEDWERYETERKREGASGQYLRDWKLTGARAHGVEISRAMESLGVDVEAQKGEESVEYLAAAVRRHIEAGTLPYGAEADVVKQIAASLGSGDAALDALRVLRAREEGRLDVAAHALPKCYDDKPATLAAAMLRAEDLSEGFDGTIGGVDALDDIDFSVLGERFAEAGLGSIDEHGVLATPIHRYEQTEDMLAALALDILRGTAAASRDGEADGGIPSRYIAASRDDSMSAIEARITASGLRAALRSSDPVSVNLAAEALSFVEQGDLHGVEMYWNDYAEPEWGAEELACIAASMAALGGEEFGFTPADSRREAAEVLGKRLGDWAGRDDLAASLDLESFGQRAAAHTIVADGNWYADPVAQGRLDMDASWTPDADAPREASVLWSSFSTETKAGKYSEFDLSTVEGYESFVQAFDTDLEDAGVIKSSPAGWGLEIRVQQGGDYGEGWVAIEDIVETAGNPWVADAWASVKFEQGGLGAEDAAAAYRAGDLTSIEDASRIHGAYKDKNFVIEGPYATNYNTAICITDPAGLSPERLSELAQTRPDLFTDALCEKHPCLADARDQVGDMWAVGDGTVTYMTAPQLEGYFATEPTLADMREAGSTWRDWVYELEGCGLAESVYGEPMREQFAAEAAARDMDAPVIEVMETEAPSRPNNDGFDH